MKAEFIENLIKILEDFPKKDILHIKVFEILNELGKKLGKAEKNVLFQYFLHKRKKLYLP